MNERGAGRDIDSQLSISMRKSLSELANQRVPRNRPSRVFEGMLSAVSNR